MKGLRLLGRYNCLLVIVGTFSKYGYSMRMKHQLMAPDIMQIFIKKFIRLHGILMSIIFYRGLVFLSQFWMKLFQAQGTFLHQTSVYHP